MELVLSMYNAHPYFPSKKCAHYTWQNTVVHKDLDHLSLPQAITSAHYINDINADWT